MTSGAERNFPQAVVKIRTASLVQTFRESVGLLGTRRFGTFWFASLLSSIGTWAQQVAEPWLLLTLGASPFVIGLDSFAGDAPIWFLTLAGGALADRSDRRRIIAAFQSIQMLCPAAIVVLLIAHRVHPWMIVALSTIVGLTDALSMPSFQSIVPSILSRDQVARGVALNSTQFNVSRIVGPAIAGALISSFGIMACFALNTLSYIPFIGIALWILPRWTPTVRREPAHDPVRVGVRQVFAQRRLRGTLLTVFLTSLLCSPLITFMPVLVQVAFHGGVGRYSIVLAMFGIGGLTGAVALLAVPTTVDRKRLNSTFAVLTGALLAVTAVNPLLAALPILLLAAGAVMTVSNTAANSLIQATADRHLLGQTVSLYMLAIRGGSALGALLTGAAAVHIGVRHALLLNGLLAVTAQIVLGFRRRVGTADAV